MSVRMTKWKYISLEDKIPHASIYITGSFSLLGRLADSNRNTTLPIVTHTKRFHILIVNYSPLPERPRLSLRTINLIQSGMPVRKCISGEKSDIVLSNHNYGRRQIKAKWNNEEFGYFNTITKIANAILCSLFMFWL